MRVKRAVIAAAGFGTRFLPQTKAVPKEMLPLIDQPIIQRVVEELVGAGIEDIIIVTTPSKRAIEDHFDAPNAEITMALTNSGKLQQLEELHRIANMANFIYIRQKKPLGNIAPLVYAAPLLQGEPFIYAFADDFVEASPSRFQQMVTAYTQTGKSILSCLKVDNDSAYDRYGIVAGVPHGKGMLKMTTIVEKPGKAKAPSDLASVSSYLFTPDILPYIQRVVDTYDGKGELKIQSAMQLMIDEGFDLLALEIAGGAFYDTGDKLEYVKTIVDFALKRSEMRDELTAFLRSKIQ